MRLTKGNPERKFKRATKRARKMAGYRSNGERETARRRRQIAKGQLKIS